MPRVLVVDDDAAIARLVSDVLSDEGYETAVALDGREALRSVLDADDFGLVLLDMRMPILDGWAFAARLREQGCTVPIVVMTAARDARRWANEIEADGYLAKPFDLDAVVDEVRRVIGDPE